MGSDVVGLVTFYLILGLSFRSTAGVPFVIKILDVHFDDGAADAPCL